MDKTNINALVQRSLHSDIDIDIGLHEVAFCQRSENGHEANELDEIF